MAKNSFDLPIDEVKGYISDLMTQIGEEITIDGIPSRAMIADLERVYSNMQQNMKRMVFLSESIISRGSLVIMENGMIGIVYTNPNDDIVSLSADVVICNCNPEVFKDGEEFDTDPSSPTFGDTLEKGLISKGFADGFIERITYREKVQDVGLLHDAILRFVTYGAIDISFELGDTFIYKTKHYRVIDIDDIAEGLLVIQLANIRIS